MTDRLRVPGNRGDWPDPGEAQQASSDAMRQLRESDSAAPPAPGPAGSAPDLNLAAVGASYAGDVTLERNRTTSPFGTMPKPAEDKMRSDLRMAVFTSMPFLTPGDEDDEFAVRALVDELYDASQDPEMWDLPQLIFDDNSKLAMLTDEQYQARLLAGENISYGDSIVSIASDLFFRRGMERQYSKAVLARDFGDRQEIAGKSAADLIDARVNQLVSEGTVGIGGGVLGSFMGAEGGIVFDEEGRNAVWDFIDTALFDVLPDRMRGEEVKEKLDQQKMLLADGDLVWDQAGDNLGLVIVRRNKETGELERVGGTAVRLDPGTKIESNADVLNAFVDATLGIAHDIPGEALQGVVARAVMKTRQWVANDPTGERQDFIESLLGQLHVSKPGRLPDNDVPLGPAIPLKPNDEAIVTMIMQSVAADPELKGEVESFDAAMERSERIANGTPIGTELATLYQHEQAAEAQLENLTDAERRFDRIVSGVGDALIAYDHATQFIGLNVINFIAQTANLPDEARGGDDLPTLWNNYVTELRSIEYGTTLGSWLGETEPGFDEEQWGDFMDLMGGLILDPLNYVIPGSKGSVMMAKNAAKEAVTNPAVGRMIVRSPVYRSFQRGLVNSPQSRALDLLRTLDMGGATDDAYWRLVRLAQDTPAERAAREGISVKEARRTMMDEAADAMFDGAAFSEGRGMGMLLGPSRGNRQQIASFMSEAVRRVRNRDEAEQLVAFMSSLGRDKSVPLDDINGFDALIEAVSMWRRGGLLSADEADMIMREYADAVEATTIRNREAIANADLAVHGYTDEATEVLSRQKALERERTSLAGEQSRLRRMQADEQRLRETAEASRADDIPVEDLDAWEKSLDEMTFEADEIPVEGEIDEGLAGAQAAFDEARTPPPDRPVVNAEDPYRNMFGDELAPDEAAEQLLLEFNTIDFDTFYQYMKDHPAFEVKPLTNAEKTKAFDEAKKALEEANKTAKAEGRPVTDPKTLKPADVTNALRGRRMEAARRKIEELWDELIQRGYFDEAEAATDDMQLGDQMEIAARGTEGREAEGIVSAERAAFHDMGGGQLRVNRAAIPDRPESVAFLKNHRRFPKPPEHGSDIVEQPAVLEAVINEARRSRRVPSQAQLQKQWKIGFARAGRIRQVLDDADIDIVHAGFDEVMEAVLAANRADPEAQALVAARNIPAKKPETPSMRALPEGRPVRVVDHTKRLEEIDGRLKAIDEELAALPTRGDELSGKINKTQQHRAWVEQNHQRMPQRAVWAHLYEIVGDRLGLDLVDDATGNFGYKAHDWDVVRAGGLEGPKAKLVNQVADELDDGPAKSLIESLLPGQDEAARTIQKKARAEDVMSRATVHSLPASPWDVMVFNLMFDYVDQIDELGVAVRKAPRPKKGVSKHLVRALHNTIEQSVTGKFMSMVRRVFAWNVLLNPVSPIVAGVDEVTRFAARTGAGVDEMAALSKSAVASIPGADGILQLVGGRTLVQRFRQWLASDTPEALAYRRADQGFTDGVSTDWEHFSRAMVNNGRRSLRAGQIGKQDYLAMVERFVNGSLLTEPRFRAIYRAAHESGVSTLDELLALDAPPQMWVDMWNGTGMYAGDTPLKLRYPRKEVNPKKGTARQTATSAHMTADEAWKSGVAYLDFFHRHAVDKTHSDLLFREIGERSTRADGAFSLTNERDRNLLFRVREIVGQRPKNFEPIADVGGRIGLTGRALRGGYGTPGDRRGAVFFDYFYDEAYNHLKGIFQAKGKLLDEAAIRRVAGALRGPDGRMTKLRWADPDFETYVQQLLRDPYSNPAVSKLISDEGYVTEAMLRTQAARYATRQADSLMYKYASGSLLGRYSENFLPFFRAQTDFWAWWSKHITKGNELRYLSDPQVKANLPSAALRAVEGFESIPLSLRPMARYAHIVAALNNEREDSNVDWALNRYMFFPFDYTDDLLIDVVPSPGPIFMPLAWTGTEAFSTWAHEQGWTDDPDDIMGALSVIWPATQYIPNGTLADRIARSVAPQTSKSSLSYLTSAGVFAETRLGQLGVPGMGPDLESSTVMRFREEELLPGFMNMFRLEVSDLFKNPDTFAQLIPPSRDTESVNWRNQLRPAQEAATNRATGKNVKETAIALSPLKADYDFDISQAPVFDSFVAAENDLRAWGVMSEEGTVGNIQLRTAFDLQRRWVDGENLSEEQQRWMMDGLVEGLRSMTEYEVVPGLTAEEYLVARHPELALLRVSAVQVNPELMNGTWADGSPELEFLTKHVGIGGRLTDVQPGKAGREDRAKWMDARWIVARPSDDVTEDAVRTTWLAKNRAVKAGWLGVTGKDWRSTNQGTESLAEVTIGGTAAELLRAGGVDVTAGEKLTRADLALMVSEQLQSRVVPVEWTSTLEDSSMALTVIQYKDGWPYMNQAKAVLDFWAEQGVERFDDLPPDAQEIVAGHLRMARDLTEEAALKRGNPINLEQTYAIDWAPTFGDYSYTDPDPAPWDSDQIDKLASFSPAEIRSGYVRIVDGDTLAVQAADGEMRVRLIGIVSPEMSTPEGPKAAAALEALLTHPNTESIGLAFWEPRTYGALHRPEPGQFRPVVWLYVNGEAVFDPDAFSEGNPFGIKARSRLVDWVDQLGWERDPGFVARASTPQQSSPGPRGEDPVDEVIPLEEQVGG